jgi:molybdenum cofactor guanylyltransferase
MATAYRSSSDSLPEPLCAIYEPKGYTRNLSFMAEGRLCPRKILINSRCEILDPIEKNALDNVNTGEEFQLAKEVLNGR